MEVTHIGGILWKLFMDDALESYGYKIIFGVFSSLKWK